MLEIRQFANCLILFLFLFINAAYKLSEKKQKQIWLNKVLIVVNEMKIEIAMHELYIK